MTGRWRANLDAKEEVFVPPFMAKGIQFIARNRRTGEGWGVFPGMPTELYTTGLSSWVLKEIGGREVSGVVADVSAFIRETVQPTDDPLIVKQLTGLVMAARAESTPDESFLRTTIKCVDQQMENNDLSTEPVPDLAELGWALAQSGESARELVGVIAKQIVQLQTREEGGWPTTSGGRASALSTSVVVRFLCGSADEFSDEIARGREYLESILNNGEGWQELGNNLVTRSHILWALALSSEAPSSLLMAGISELRVSQNEDGGWGDGLGEVSSIESTAAALLALAASGETRFVQSRVAQAALSEANKAVYRVSQERDELRRDLRAKVEREVGKVIAERDSLRRDKKALAARLSRLETEVELSIASPAHDVEIGSHFYYLLRKRFRSITTLAGTLFAITGIFLGVLLFVDPQMSIVTSTMLAVSVLLAGVFIFLIPKTFFRRIESEARRRQAFREFSSRSDMQQFQRDFLEMSQPWPTSVREEVVYRLFTEIVNLPPDVAIRFAEDLVFRFEMPPRVSREFQSWLRELLKLPRADQRVILERIRRVIL